MSIPVLKNLDFPYPANKLSQQQCSGSAEHSNVILLLRTVENGPTLLQYLNEGKSIKKYIKKRNRKLNQMVLSIPTFCTANMGHMETSVQSTVNHCNQDYSYSTVFLKLDCCSKCSEITVNLKSSGLLYHLHFSIVLCMANTCMYIRMSTMKPKLFGIQI